jgi:hypothetical protein
MRLRSSTSLHTCFTGDLSDDDKFDSAVITLFCQSVVAAAAPAQRLTWYILKGAPEIEFTNMQGSICAFINYKQAARFGHVGWAFRLPDGNYYFGSSDHLWKHNRWDMAGWWRYMHVPAHGDIDWWDGQAGKTDMLAIMKSGPHIHYHAYKEIELPDCSSENAIMVANQIKVGGWHVTAHNCVNQAYLIFSGYSREHSLPDPFEDPLNLIPKIWFARISGSTIGI